MTDVRYFFTNTIPSGMEKQPFIEFNIAEKTLNGTAGCNVINGSFNADDANPVAISFAADRKSVV